MYEDKPIVLDLNKEYGVVLEGGGAKGAYQVGVWKALKEAGVKIKAVAGASVGALNGALMCMDDLDKAMYIWQNIKYSQVMDIDDKQAHALMTRNFKSLDTGELIEKLKGVLLGGGFDITPLRTLLEETVDEKRIRQSKTDLYVTTFSIDDIKEEVIDVKDVPQGHIADMLMASAYFPAFKQEELAGGRRYMDGGTFNNVPIDVLIDKGYKDIIVIRIHGWGLDKEKLIKVPSDVNLYHIAPAEDLGGILEFDNKKSKYNIKLGYADGVRFLHGKKPVQHRKKKDSVVTAKLVGETLETISSSIADIKKLPEIQTMIKGTEKMGVNLHGRNFITLKDYTPDEISYLLTLAAKLKADKKKGKLGTSMKGKNVALIFEKPSTRTRCAFTIGCTDEGAHPEYLGKDDIQLGHKESVKDTARVLGRMFDGIEFRGFKHSTVEELAEYAGVPVWNGLTDEYHPTQILADLLTMQEHFGKLKGLSFVYAGDGRNNMANSLMIGMSKMGVNFTIIAPKSLWPKDELVKLCKGYAKESGSTINISDSTDAVKGADVIYTDVWASMGEEDKAAERIKLLSPYQVNDELMAKTGKKTTIFMHCLPAVKGKEVTEDVFESKASVVFDEAENRMHTIKAVMVATLGK